MSTDASTSFSMKVTISLLNKKFSNVKSITTNILHDWLSNEHSRKRLMVLVRIW